MTAGYAVIVKISLSVLSQAVAYVESGGNSKAISPKGAIGTHQVMPIAMREVMRARGEDDSVFTDSDLRRIASQEGVSQEYGEAYLKLLLRRFPDIRLALAAYNAGPTRVGGLVKHFGEYKKLFRYLPKETQNYVPKVLTEMGRLLGSGNV